MKACPFCAEAIQDAAVVCKHCGRDFDGAPVRATPARPRPAARRPFVLAAAGAFLCGAAVVGAASGQALVERLAAPALADSAARPTGAEAGPLSTPAGGTEAVVRRQAAPPPPQVLELVDEDATEVGPEQWLHYGFTVGRDAGDSDAAEGAAPACRLAGRVLALTGANKDVEVSVLSADDYLNWRNGHAPPYTALFSGPRQTATTLDVELPSAGEYHLVVSNRFSVATAKTVQARAQVVCARAAAGDA